MQTIRRSELIAVFKYYENELMSKFYRELLTQSTIYRMEAYLQQIQRRMQQTERNPVWTVPIKLNINPSTNGVELEPVLYDFELIG